MRTILHITITHNSSAICSCLMEMDKGVRDDNFTPTRPGLARPDQNHLAPHGHYSPRRGGGAGTGQDFCPDHRGGAVMGIGIDPPRPAPTFNNITKILVFIIM